MCCVRSDYNFQARSLSREKRRLPSYISSSPTGRISAKFDIHDIFMKNPRNPNLVEIGLCHIAIQALCSREMVSCCYASREGMNIMRTCHNVKSRILYISSYILFK